MSAVFCISPFPVEVKRTYPIEVVCLEIIFEHKQKLQRAETYMAMEFP